MRVRFYHWYNAVLAALLSMLGIQSCGDNGGGGNLEMYGTPIVDFQVKGNVTDGEGRALQGIKVKVEEQDGTYKNGIDSVTTDADGAYQTKVLNAVTLRDKSLKLVVEDVDGAENGDFRSDTLTLSDLEMRQTKKGDGSWYQGRYELTGNVTLKEK